MDVVGKETGDEGLKVGMGDGSEGLEELWFGPGTFTEEKSHVVD